MGSKSSSTTDVMNGVMNTSNEQNVVSNTSSVINVANHQGTYNEGNTVGGSVLTLGGVINRAGGVQCYGATCGLQLQNLEQHPVFGSILNYGDVTNKASGSGVQCFGATCGQQL